METAQNQSHRIYPVLELFAELLINHRDPPFSLRTGLQSTGLPQAAAASALTARLGSPSTASYVILHVFQRLNYFFLIYEL